MTTDEVIRLRDQSQSGEQAPRSMARLKLSMRMFELEKGIRAGMLTGPGVRGELARIKGVLFDG